MASLQSALLFAVCITSLLALTTARLSVAEGALKDCGEKCKAHTECKGKIACMDGVCNDDPDLRTHICRGKVAPPKRHGGLKDCGESCKSNDECKGQVACMNGVCNDDPDMGTDICKNAKAPSSFPFPIFPTPPAASPLPAADGPAGAYESAEDDVVYSSSAEQDDVSNHKQKKTCKESCKSDKECQKGLTCAKGVCGGFACLLPGLLPHAPAPAPISVPWFLPVAPAHAPASKKN